jgi:hypothetical protein
MGGKVQARFLYLWPVLVLLGMHLSSLPMMAAYPDPETAQFAHTSLAKLKPVLGGPLRIALSGILLVIIGVRLRGQQRRIWQADRDREASGILGQLRDGGTPSREFFLYLRAFETTGRLRPPLFAFNFKTLGLMQWHRNELEHLLGRAMRRQGVLVALGRPGENLGAGRIVTSDERWKQDIALLVTAARGVLLIPSSHKGTAWEVDLLKNHAWLAKTVFLMPPQSRKFDWKARWSESRAALGELGSHLPEYEEMGLLFTMGTDGALKDAEPFQLSSERLLRKSITRLLAKAPPAGDASHALAKAEKRSRRWRRRYRVNVYSSLGAAALYVYLVVAAALKVGDAHQRAPTAAERLRSSPLFVERTRGMTEDQASAYIGQLSDKGLSRLDDDSVVAFYSAYAQLLARADEATCEAIATETASPDAVGKLIDGLGEPSRTRFLEAIAMAALAELEQRPAPTLTQAEVDDAEEQFVGTLTPDEQQKLAAFATQTDPSLRDLCFWRRKYPSSLSVLKEPQRHVLARYLAQKWGM